MSEDAQQTPSVMWHIATALYGSHRKRGVGYRHTVYPDPERGLASLIRHDHLRVMHAAKFAVLGRHSGKLGLLGQPQV